MPAATILEIEAIYQSERIRFDDVAIIQCRLAASTQAMAAGSEVTPDNPDFYRVNLGELFGDSSASQSALISIKVECNPDDFSPSVTYRFFGRWTEYKNRHTGRSEQQFHAQTFVRAKPHGRQGIIAYLRQAPNIGQVRASKLWDSFNSDAVRVLREQPEVAASVLKLADDKAAEAAAWLARESALEDCQIELIDVLGGRGFPKSIARRAVQAWGNRASEVIRFDPYRLMGFRGCGFKRCDALYLDLGLPPGRRKRQALCAWYTLASDNEGHSWFPLDYVLAGLRGSITGGELNPGAALKLAKRARAIATMRTDGPRGGFVDQGGFLWIAEGKKARQEQAVAEHLAAASLEPAAWPTLPSDSPLSPHQIENYQRATSGGTIAILGGSPGTGKTFTAAQAIKAAIALLGGDNIAVAAPTGKAAVRITEAMQAYGIDLRAKTIHSMLGRPGQNETTGEWTFAHHAGNPLPFRLIVTDEFSMCDTGLACSLFSARPKGCHVLIIGDVNQLPPVGHGAPLRDMIAAGLPYGELREIRRNSGAIVQACADMRDGRSFQCVKKVDIGAGQNLKLIEAHSPDAQIEKMLAALNVARGMGVDPVWDCQVLVPVNDKSPLGRKKLNKVLQEALNPTPAERSTDWCRPRDKVVNLKNGYFKLVETGGTLAADDEIETNEKNETYIANGELAEVLHVEEKSFIARLTSPTRVVRVPMGKQKGGEGDESADGQCGDGENSDKTATGCSWDLAYALSTHKSQGSEWPVVIVMLDEYPGARMVCSREHLYTSISRAKKMCLLIGKLATAHGFTRKVALGKRKTFLKELIRREIAKCQQP